MTTNFDRTANWLESCGKEPGNPHHLSTQIGCHLEEITELLRTLRVDSSGGELVLNRVAVDLGWLANKLKSGDYTAHIAAHHRVEALDALCDGEVTGNGIAYLSKFDKDEADQRVLDANDAKLINGKPVLLPGGKIGKPEGWKAADLTDLI
jgi:predicted HAD superfamily Cof-like phosphohydrolase